jgi:hypothetical protein
MADVLTQSDLFNLFRDNADIRLEDAEHSSDIRRETAAGVADIRRETAEHTADIRREDSEGVSRILLEQAKGLDNINSDVKATGWSVADRVGAESAKIINQQTQFYIAAAAESARNALEAAKVSYNILEGQALINRTTTHEAMETRKLINDLQVQDLNRMLIEKNSVLMEERVEGRSLLRAIESNQFATLQGNINSLHAQIHAGTAVA